MQLTCCITFIKRGDFITMNPIPFRRKIEKTIPDLLQPLPAQEVCGCLELAREEEAGFQGIVVQAHLLVPVRVPLQFPYALVITVERLDS
jgi:hypothetical protein